MKRTKHMKTLKSFKNDFLAFRASVEIVGRENIKEAYRTNLVSPLRAQIFVSWDEDMRPEEAFKVVAAWDAAFGRPGYYGNLDFAGNPYPSNK